MSSILLVYNALGRQCVNRAEGWTGQVFTDDGQIIPMTNVEIRDNNVLYFEMEVDYNLIETSMTIEGKKYTGTIVADGGEVPVTGEKID